MLGTISQLDRSAGHQPDKVFLAGAVRLPVLVQAGTGALVGEYAKLLIMVIHWQQEGRLRNGYIRICNADGKRR
jgi:hypothetical protein